MVLWSKIIVMLRGFLTTASGLGHYFHLPLTYCSNLPAFSVIIYSGLDRNVIKLYFDQSKTVIKIIAGSIVGSAVVGSVVVGSIVVCRLSFVFGGLPLLKWLSSNGPFSETEFFWGSGPMPR